MIIIIVLLSHLIRRFSKDYYKILECSTASTKEELRKSYIMLTKKYHPGMPEGNLKKFEEVSEAYEVLKDRKLRSEYDHRYQYRSWENRKNQIDEPTDMFVYDFYKTKSFVSIISAALILFLAMRFQFNKINKNLREKQDRDRN